MCIIVSTNRALKDITTKIISGDIKKYDNIITDFDSTIIHVYLEENSKKMVISFSFLPFKPLSIDDASTLLNQHDLGFMVPVKPKDEYDISIECIVNEESLKEIPNLKRSLFVNPIRSIINKKINNKRYNFNEKESLVVEGFDDRLVCNFKILEKNPDSILTRVFLTKIADCKKKDGFVKRSFETKEKTDEYTIFKVTFVFMQRAYASEADIMDMLDEIFLFKASSKLHVKRLKMKINTEMRKITNNYISIYNS